FNPFEGPEIKHILQTTDAQEEIWYSCYFGGEAANIAYNLSLTIKLQGQLNVNALQLAVDELIARHESLRSSFSPDGKYINVFSSVFTNIDLVDYSQLSVEKAKEAIHNYTEQDTNTAFDLTKGPLIRFAMLKLDEEVYNFTITAHHIVCDGWSVGIIMQEIGALYSSKVLHKSH
ncbi:unnamed protein product, partial [Ectocarpus sp. 12 AP-2014]